jgi:hypothetical protein
MKRDRHKEWIRLKSRLQVRKAFLIVQLGGKCRECETTENLELDHPNGKPWEAKKMSPRQRMKQYEEDNINGQLSLLCRSCNGSDGALNKEFYSAIRHGKAPF